MSDRHKTGRAIVPVPACLRWRMQGRLSDARVPLH